MTLRQKTQARHAVRVVNVSSYCFPWSMFGVLFPLVYAVALICFLLQAFRMMKVSASSASLTQSDRTGLQTVHPELLDQNGCITSEELWAVRFSEEGEAGWAAKAG